MLDVGATAAPAAAVDGWLPFACSLLLLGCCYRTHAGFWVLWIACWFLFLVCSDWLLTCRCLLVAACYLVNGNQVLFLVAAGADAAKVLLVWFAPFCLMAAASAICSCCRCCLLFLLLLNTAATADDAAVPAVVTAPTGCCCVLSKT